jgi:hypothetical integral membrane protein (TIGR02206 family)
MLKYFSKAYDDQFQLFSIVHWLTLASVFALVIIIAIFRNYFRNQSIDKAGRYIIASILIISEISLAWWLYYTDSWSLSASLPFHISSISLLLSAILLLTRSYALFEITYFVGVGSALHSIFTPDISAYTFPHFRYVHFFVSHGGIIVANAFMIFVHRFRPALSSLWKATIALNLYMVFIFFINKIVGGNYLYISKKPVNPSIIDYLGPWPWYILSLEGLAIVTFFLLYLPFHFSKK